MPEDFRRTDESRVADAVFEALADERRRLALYYLRERGSASVEELATVVSGWTQARRADPEMVVPDDRDAAKIRLHHATLPKLAESGFVSYDHETGDVALADAPDLLEVVLDQSLERERAGHGSAARSGNAGRDDQPRRDDESGVGDR